MIATPQAKITPVHPLARFVTKDAIAQLLNIQPEQIRDIRCWPRVILVVGIGISRFVSYADMPPAVGVEPPSLKDVLRWRKRWKKIKTKQAPAFWVEFYAQKFRHSASLAELYEWGQLVSQIEFSLSEVAIKWLRSVYLDAQTNLNS